MKVRLIFVLSLILALSMSTLLLSGQEAASRRKYGDRARVAVQPMGIKCPAERTPICARIAARLRLWL